jgi:hypothetical protein
MVYIHLAANAVGVGVVVVVAVGQVYTVNVAAGFLYLQKLLEVIRIHLRVIGRFVVVQQHQVCADVLVERTVFALGNGLVSVACGYGLPVRFSLPFTLRRTCELTNRPPWKVDSSLQLTLC